MNKSHKRKSKNLKYSTTCPIYPSIKSLWSQLGIQDSCFQSNQIALEFFQEHISLTNIEEKLFIDSLAKKYKISSGSHTWDENKERIAQSYVVQTYNITELFFKDLISEYRGYNKIEEWKTHKKIGSSNKAVDPFNQIIMNLPKSIGDELKSKPEYYLIDYYRLVRNGIVHSGEHSFDRPNHYYQTNIIPHLKHFESYYKYLDEGLPAPNPPNKLTFRDFILYSRSLRYYSLFVNQKLNLNGDQIFQVHKNDKFFKLDLAKEFHQKDRSMEKTYDRIKKDIRNYLMVIFNVQDEAYVEQVFQSFKNYRSNL